PTRPPGREGRAMSRGDGVGGPDPARPAEEGGTGSPRPAGPRAARSHGPPAFDLVRAARCRAAAAFEAGRAWNRTRCHWVRAWVRPTMGHRAAARLAARSLGGLARLLRAAPEARPTIQAGVVDEVARLLGLTRASAHDERRYELGEDLDDPYRQDLD